MKLGEAKTQVVQIHKLCLNYSLRRPWIMQSLSKEQTIAQIGIIEKRQLRGPTCTIALKKTHFHKKVVSAPQCTMKHREIIVGLFEYFFKSKMHRHVQKPCSRVT